jgi:ectoine hydroxylase-related dioxygenase (phytanoyl-CoA dioxygenase family)
MDRIVEEFERTGFVVVRAAMSPEEMAPIQAQWARLRDPLRAGEVVDGIRRDNFYIHGRLPSPVGDVYRHPVIVDVANRLLGPDVAIYLNRLNVKDNAFRDLIHLHQDMPFFNGGGRKINFFIALQDINLNNGAMVFVPGSHRLGVLDRNTIDISKHPELDVVVPSLRPGDLAIADIRLWHSSVPNAAGTDRVLLQMIFQPADDGSYYPFSVPAPEVITGEWHTDQFPAWELIRAPAEKAPAKTDDQIAGSRQDTPIRDSVQASEAQSSSADIENHQSTSESAIDRSAVVRIATAAPTDSEIAAAPPGDAPVTPTSVPGVAVDAVPLAFIASTARAILPVGIKHWIRRAVTAAMNTADLRAVPPGASGQNGSGLRTEAVVAEPPAPRKPARDLPRFFTPSTGPEQVWSLPETEIDWATELEATARYLRQVTKTDVLLAVRTRPEPPLVAQAEVLGLNVKGYVHIAQPGEDPLSPYDGRPVYQPQDLPRLAGIGAIVVLCSRDFSLAVRSCEHFLRDDILFVPGTTEAIVGEPVRAASVGDWALRSSILTYLYVSGLRGDFAEFGTFWGRAFFGSFYELHHWLQGKMYAFDSFEGLSEPDPREKSYTNGDFAKGAYGFNHASFRAVSDILGLPKERIVTVPGFFDKTLTPQKARELGLAPRSLSVCRIDCDLLEPTRAVLEFITPWLDDGALIYFDDWRLCRADPTLGERGAVMSWLKANPSFELVDFHSIHWQHQWFIFHRNKQA